MELGDFDVAYIREIETGLELIHATLAAMGRGIYIVRKGEKMNRNYTFEDYSLEGDNIDVCYRWSWQGDSDAIHVVFPQSYLEIDWVPVETARVEKEKAENAAKLAEAEEKKRLELEERERAVYERLKAKFD